jgi:hypothetical protein
VVEHDSPLERLRGLAGRRRLLEDEDEAQLAHRNVSRVRSVPTPAEVLREQAAVRPGVVLSDLAQIPEPGDRLVSERGGPIPRDMVARDRIDESSVREHRRHHVPSIVLARRRREERPLLVEPHQLSARPQPARDQSEPMVPGLDVRREDIDDREPAERSRGAPPCSRSPLIFRERRGGLQRERIEEPGWKKREPGGDADDREQADVQEDREPEVKQDHQRDEGGPDPSKVRGHERHGDRDPFDEQHRGRHPGEQLGKAEQDSAERRRVILEAEHVVDRGTIFVPGCPGLEDHAREVDDRDLEGVSPSRCVADRRTVGRALAPREEGAEEEEHPELLVATDQDHRVSILHRREQKPGRERGRARVIAEHQGRRRKRLRPEQDVLEGSAAGERVKRWAPGKLADEELAPGIERQDSEVGVVRIDERPLRGEIDEQEGSDRDPEEDERAMVERADAGQPSSQA